MDNLHATEVSDKTAHDRRITVDQLDRQQRNISITWLDGHRSIFHHIWLRDNCACTDCGDRSGGHRYLELADIDDHISPDEISLEDSGKLLIKWSGDGHLTEYESAWLRQHCYSDEAVAERRHQPILWDSSLNDSIAQWDYREIVADQTLRLSMFQHINDYGFAVIDQVPIEVDQIEKLAAIFGFIRQTHYGHVFELISTPQQRILAQTSHAIRPHNDENFRDPIPGLFMMHCLRASECGGGATTLVDGFQVASKFRTENREAFDLLCQIPIPHQRFLVDEVDDVALSAHWRAIEIDHHGNIVAVHINERTMAPLDCTEHQVEPVYRALKEFFNQVYAPQASINYRLESGQAVVLDNHRVLHARTAFNGNRHIRQCHVDRDEFFSRLRALRRRLDVNIL